MPITEFALLHLSTPPPPSPSLLTTLSAAMHIQSAWHATHFPDLPSSAAARAAIWFTQVEDPSWLLTTARWQSTAAHWDWIRSAENVGVMRDGLGGEIVAGDTVLWHVEGGIFAGGGGGGEKGSSLLLESPVISVGRIFVRPGDREAFAARFEAVKGVLEAYAGPHLVRYGWRDDLEEGAEEDEFVLVCGWESVERHSGFVESDGFDKYDAQIRELIARVDLKHYRRLLLE